MSTHPTTPEVITMETTTPNIVTQLENAKAALAVFQTAPTTCPARRLPLICKAR